MSSNAEAALTEFQKQIGQVEGPTDWHKVDQDQINLFADATGDHQFIHVDPERAAKTPFGSTIAHGFLTLSMLPKLQAGMGASNPAALKGMAMAINYGLDKVRFISPVNVDAKIRATRELMSAELKGNAVQLKHEVKIEIEGVDKPACVAQAITRFVYS